MGFSIASTRCIGHPERNTITKLDKGLLAGDGALALLCAGAGGAGFILMFTGVIPSVGFPLEYIVLPVGVGVGAGIVVIDLATLLLRIRAASKIRANDAEPSKKPEVEAEKTEEESEVEGEETPVTENESEKDIREGKIASIKQDILDDIKGGSKAVSMTEHTKIFDNLYLGGIALFNYGKNGEVFLPTNKKPRVIITCCPLHYLSNDGLQEDEVSENMKQNGYEWIFLGESRGETLNIEEAKWMQLVCKATLMSQEDFDKSNPANWFEPIFADLDRAILDEEILVMMHCGQGTTRSPLLLAAYLIKRFGLTADQAIAYLGIKRGGIMLAKFRDQLSNYELALALKK